MFGTTAGSVVEMPDAVGKGDLSVWMLLECAARTQMLPL